jgi:hypothetical protein
MDVGTSIFAPNRFEKKPTIKSEKKEAKRAPVTLTNSANPENLIIPSYVLKI